jgi:hypothetical protein
MSLLTDYKKYIKEIKNKKGTAAWLKDFVRTAGDYGVLGKNRTNQIMKNENLSPQEFYYLSTVARKLENGEACSFINQGLADFLTKYGFNVEPVETGWIASEGKV